MIRLVLTAALVGGLLQHVFGQEPARRKGSGKRARARVASAR